MRETPMCGCLSRAPYRGPWPTTQAGPRALTGNRTGDPLIHRLALSPQSHTSQGADVSLDQRFLTFTS